MYVCTNTRLAYISALDLSVLSARFGHSKLLMTKNCSETALKKVREKVVSLEAQTPTNEAKLSAL